MERGRQQNESLADGYPHVSPWFAAQESLLAASQMPKHPREAREAALTDASDLYKQRAAFLNTEIDE